MIILNCTTSDSEFKISFKTINGEYIPLNYPDNGLHLEVIVEENENTCCPHCGSKNIKSHEFHKKERIHAGSFNEAPVYFYFSHHRYMCNDCGRTFMYRIEDLPLYAHITNNAHYAILHAIATRTLDDVAESYGVSSPTIRNILLDFSKGEREIRLKGSYRYLSMDEIFSTRDKEGKAIYFWVLNDLSTPWKVNNIRIDIGRTKEAIIKRLKQLNHLETVTAVAIDMWSSYRDVIESVFPNAIAVVDPFHVIQTAERQMDLFRKNLVVDSEFKKILKENSKLLTTKLYKLTDEELDLVETYISANKELENAYFLLQELLWFYTIKDYEEALTYLSEWEKEVLDSDIGEMKKILKTIQNWLPWIMNYFIHRITNGKTEGRNNLIRTIERQGFHYGIETLQGCLYAYDTRYNIKKWRKHQKRMERRKKIA